MSGWGDVSEYWKLVRVRLLVDRIAQGWLPQGFNYLAEYDEWGVI